ncbi:hypothetical protein RUM43_000825 [Polyplax serrata]|uniref:Uncharacterized protein n=1 Tax=Polyplax serrata TaxID=468196 RepID=A0AAN8XNN7_POLSC
MFIFFSGTQESICSSDMSRTCCTPQIEKELMFQVRQNFRDLLYHNSKSIEGVLAKTTRMLEELFKEVDEQESSEKAENGFHGLEVLSKRKLSNEIYEVSDLQTRRLVTLASSSPKMESRGIHFSK